MPYDPLSLPQDASLFLLGHVFPSAKGPLTAVSMGTLELQWFNPESVSGAHVYLVMDYHQKCTTVRLHSEQQQQQKKNQATFFFLTARL